MSDFKSSHLIAASLECFPEKLSWCRNERVCQVGGKNVVKRFEQSNGLDIALSKNYLYLCVILKVKGMYLYSIMSVGPLKSLYTLPLADLFIPTPTRLLWEEFSHAAITA